MLSKFFCPVSLRVGNVALGCVQGDPGSRTTGCPLLGGHGHHQSFRESKVDLGWGGRQGREASRRKVTTRLSSKGGVHVAKRGEGGEEEGGREILSRELSMFCMPCALELKVGFKVRCGGK